VTGGYYDGGEFLLIRICVGLGVGEIEERGYGEVGLGFVEDLFDVEAIGLRAAQDFGVEGRFFGKAADEGEDFFAD
jgi:hypothetical protein